MPQGARVMVPFPFPPGASGRIAVTELARGEVAMRGEDVVLRELDGG